MRVEVQLKIKDNNKRVPRINLWKNSFGMPLKVAKDFDDQEINKLFTSEDFGFIYVYVTLTSNQLGMLFANLTTNSYTQDNNVVISSVEIIKENKNYTDLTGGKYE